MFTCVLRHYVDPKVLVPKRLANFTEGAGSLRLEEAISVDRCAEIASSPSVRNQLWQSLELGVPEARLGVGFIAIGKERIFEKRRMAVVGVSCSISHTSGHSLFV